MKKILLILLVIITAIGCSKKEEVVYILPEGYTGYVVVLYNQADGVEEKYEGDKRVYEIPSSGILKTKFKADYGWSEFPEFYYGKIDESNRIPYVYDFEQVPTDKVVSYGGTSGTANKDLEGTSSVKFTNYHIGNKEQIKVSAERANSIDYVQLEAEN